MKKEYNNIRIKTAGKNEELRLPPRVIHIIVCEILEDALVPGTDLPVLKGGFLTGSDLEVEILNRQQRIVGESQKDLYTVKYNVADMVVKSINPKLKTVGGKIIREKLDRKVCFKGYPGLAGDYKSVMVKDRELPVDKGIFEFIKGTMDFSTMSAIRNLIYGRAEKAWQDFRKENPKFDTNTSKKKEVKAMSKPDAPFICIESSIYEFTPDYEAMIARERSLFLQFADAIICRKAVKVAYQALHYDKPDDLEFHPHYIRKVGTKLMIYGRSRSIAFHGSDEYTLVNLIVQRVKSVDDFEEDIHYYSAKELGLDYNNKVFLDRVTFDAPGYYMGDETCTEVVLKVRKRVETPGNPRMPFQRILSEPLHHSQRVLTERDEPGFGYVSIRVKDYMRMKPILMTWGSDIRVESPESLRQVMLDEVRRLAEFYGIPTEGIDTLMSRV